ncbi:MAG: hypothetical protein RLZZ74_704 [Cyanobacteriota bacterium]|jgi:hypothetical protein
MSDKQQELESVGDYGQLNAITIDQAAAFVGWVRRFLT